MAKKLVKYFVVDAFADSPFKGNQAAICFLEEDRDEQWLQSVAAEFNLSETAFLTRRVQPPRDCFSDSPIPRFSLRWFTPVEEVELCGHATLAAAHTLFTSGTIDSELVEFVTLSGLLTAKRITENKASDGTDDSEANNGFFIELNFPLDPFAEIDSSEYPQMSKALRGASVVDMRRTTLKDLIVVVPSAESVTDLQPDFDALGNYPARGIIVTAIAPLGSGFDFYSRFFAPNYGIKEDPVTGSAHCSLAPYWSKQLGKSDFVAYQASQRGGVLNIHLDEQSQRVLLRGKAFTVMEGTLLV